jgi:hypothetical protein
MFRARLTGGTANVVGGAAALWSVDESLRSMRRRIHGEES